MSRGKILARAHVLSRRHDRRMSELVQGRGVGEAPKWRQIMPPLLSLYT